MCMVGIRLQAIEEIHVRRILAHGHDTHQTLSVGIRQVVLAYECIPLSDELFWRHAAV